LLENAVFDKIKEPKVTLEFEDSSEFNKSLSESMSFFAECKISGGVWRTSHDSSILENYMISYAKQQEAQICEFVDKFK